MDEVGLVGPGVQVPSPAVWQILAHAVRVDKARTVAALITALGGPLRGGDDSAALTELSLECYLAMLMPQTAEAVGDTVRVLCRDAPVPRWRTGVVTVAAAGVVLAQMKGVDAPMRLDRIDWRYVVATPAGPAAPPARAAAAPRTAKPLSLTSPGPDERGRARAVELRRVERMQAAAIITQRISLGAGEGNRIARRALLAIHLRQTEDERQDDCSKYRNAAGWSKFDAPRAGHLVRAIRGGRALSAAEAAECRELAITYAAQLVDSEHLAAVCGRADDASELSDAWDSGSEEEGDVEAEGAFLAPEDVDTEPLTGATFSRAPEGRLMNPRVHAFFEALLRQHEGRTAKIANDMVAALPALDDFAVHTALALAGAPASKVGDRVMVPYAEERAFFAGVVTRITPRYAFVEYQDKDAMPMDEMQLLWHYKAVV